MDLISKKPLFKKRVITVWASILLFLHMLFTLLSVYHSYIREDIAHKSADALLGYLIPALAFLIIYVRFSVMVSAYHSYEKGTLPFTLTVTASFLLSRISEYIIYCNIYSVASVSTGIYFLNSFISFMIDLAVIMIILFFSRSKKERQRKITRLIIITCLIPLSIALITELVFIIDAWAYVGFERIVLTPSMIERLKLLPLEFVKAVLGFVLIFVTHKILRKLSQK